MLFPADFYREYEVRKLEQVLLCRSKEETVSLISKTFNYSHFYMHSSER